MQKLRKFKKKSWSQMIPNHLIRRKMQKKNFLVAVEVGGERRRRRSRRRFMKDTKTLGNYIISKTMRFAPKIKLLVYRVTRRDILPPPPPFPENVKN